MRYQEYEVGDWIQLDFPQERMHEEGGITGVQGKYYQIAQVEDFAIGTPHYYLDGVVYTDNYNTHQKGEMCSWSSAWFLPVDEFVLQVLNTNQDD